MRQYVFGSFTLVLISVLMGGCSTQPSATDYYRSSTDSNLVASPTAVVYSPSTILVFDEDHPPTQSSQPIKTIQIDVYNEYGIMRQQAQVNEMLKEQACSLGGNAIVLIDNPNDKKHCYAEVIQLSTTPANNAAAFSVAPAENTSSVATTKSPG